MSSKVEALLAELGLPHAVLRPNLFMDEVTMGDSEITLAVFNVQSKLRKGQLIGA